MRWTVLAVIVSLFLTGAMNDRPAYGSNAMQMGEVQTIPPDLDLGKESRSESGAYAVTYKVMGGVVPFDRLHDWMLSIKDRDGRPVHDVHLTITNSMPGHPHGAKTTPKMTRHLKGGNHLIEGMQFSMKGWWKTVVTIEKGGQTDRVEFNNVLK